MTEMSSDSTTTRIEYKREEGGWEAGVRSILTWVNSFTTEERFKARVTGGQSSRNLRKVKPTSALRERLLREMGLK